MRMNQRTSLGDVTDIYGSTSAPADTSSGWTSDPAAWATPDATGYSLALPDSAGSWGFTPAPAGTVTSAGVPDVLTSAVSAIGRFFNTAPAAAPGAIPATNIGASNQTLLLVGVALIAAFLLLKKD